MRRRFALGFALLLSLAAFAPQVLRADWWWLRVLDFPRLQLFVLGLVALAALAPFLTRRPLRSWPNALMALTLAATALQGARILPYTPLWAKQVAQAAPGEPGPSLRLLVVNVLMENRDDGRVLDQTETAASDLALFMETDAWWVEALRPLRGAYPHAVEVPQDNTYGMVLYSRLPLESPEVKYLIEADVPSIHAEVALGERRVALRFVHPKPPVPTEALDTTERDAELLLVGQEVRALDRPAVVAGDLNDVAWSRTTRLFQRVSGTLDPRRGRGLYASFHADYPFLRWPLDHVFHTEHFELVALERLGPNGSDHFPILVELRLTPDARLEQDRPDPEPGDREEAEEQIEEGT